MPLKLTGVRAQQPRPGALGIVASGLRALRPLFLDRGCSKLMYCSHSGDGNWAVWVMNADGSVRRQLTHPTLIQPAGAHGDYPGAWSPRRQTHSSTPPTSTATANSS